MENIDIYIARQITRKLRLVLAPPAKTLSVAIPRKFKARGYTIAMTMNLKFGSTQIFEALAYCTA